MRGNTFRWDAIFTGPRLLLASFATVILTGAATLSIDLAWSGNGQRIAPVDALFMATSAVCVTGLTVRDVGQDFSLLGQGVILFLIQIGGLGILTFSNFLLLLRTGHMNIQQRELVESMHGSLPNISPRSLLIHVVAYALTIEAAGAVALSARFMMDYPFPQAVWLGVFHAVSCFCNSGLSLFSDSLMGYRTDSFVNLTCMTLIVLGGLGFVVHTDLVGGLLSRTRTSARRMLMLHTRVVLVTTSILIVVGTTFVFLLELNGTASQGSWYQRLLDSAFLAVTSRTAGFNTVDTGMLTNGTLLVVILLMIVGGSPGSTAGGIKTTTVAIIYAILAAETRNRAKTELFSRTIPNSVVIKAIITSTSFIWAAVVFTLVLQVTELPADQAFRHRGMFLDCLFEVVSAMGTVGLSTGITPTLSTVGKFVIIACMYMGRVGPLMIASSIVGHQPAPERSFPEENILVG